MYIGEVCKCCNVTKKAIRYYEEQGLINPKINLNGYKEYNEEQIKILKKIVVLRNLGLSINDISQMLKTGNASKTIISKKLEINQEQEKLRLLEELSKTNNWEEIEEKLKLVQQKQTVLDRIIKAFPGSYGNYLCLHFAVYLNEPINTEDKRKAYEEIIDFLDNVDFKLPLHIEKFLEDIFKQTDEEFVSRLHSGMNDAAVNPEKYFEEHKDVVESYMEYKKSKEFKESIANELGECLKTFQREHGYYDVFIPAMKRLSSRYNGYMELLNKADKVFAKKFNV